MRAAEIAAHWGSEAEQRASIAAQDVARADTAAKLNAETAQWVVAADWRLAAPLCARWAYEARSWSEAGESPNSKNKKDGQVVRERGIQAFFPELKTEMGEVSDEPTQHEASVELADTAMRLAKNLLSAPKSETEAKHAAQKLADHQGYGAGRQTIYLDGGSVSVQDYAVQLLREAEAGAWAAIEAAARAKTGELRGRVARDRQGVALAESAAVFDAMEKLAAAPEQAGETRRAADDAAGKVAEARTQHSKASHRVTETKKRAGDAQSDTKQAKKELEQATAAYEKESNGSRRATMRDAQRAWTEAVENMRGLEAAVAEGEQALAAAKAAMAEAEANAETTKKAASSASAAIGKLQAEVSKVLAAERAAIDLAKAAAISEVTKWQAEAAVMHKAASKWEAEAKALARSKAGGH